MTTTPPVLSVSCGDPAGIGLEALIKALDKGFLPREAALILHVVPGMLEALASSLRHGGKLARLDAWTELEPTVRPDAPRSRIEAAPISFCASISRAEVIENSLPCSDWISVGSRASSSGTT